MSLLLKSTLLLLLMVLLFLLFKKLLLVLPMLFFVLWNAKTLLFCRKFHSWIMFYHWWWCQFCSWCWLSVVILVVFIIISLFILSLLLLSDNSTVIERRLVSLKEKWQGLLDGYKKKMFLLILVYSFLCWCHLVPEVPSKHSNFWLLSNIQHQNFCSETRWQERKLHQHFYYYYYYYYFVSQPSSLSFIILVISKKKKSKKISTKHCLITDEVMFK